jgi:dephospho-CoA kinase
MRKPVIVVTGGIATGKTTVARALAAREGSVIDCDRIGHKALDTKAVKRALTRAFGRGILKPSGRISRIKLGRIVFADQSKLDLLNRSIRTILRRMISAEVMRRRKSAEYIVLDAVLYFQYKFRFKVDLVVRTVASKESRLERLAERDGMERKEALDRIARQESLAAEWRKADISIRTDGPVERVIERTNRIRERFLKAYLGSGKER